MASTKVPIELSSTPGIVDNSNATAITIDSSENVALTGGLTLANSQYLSSTDASSNAPRMLGINSGNTTYIAPIDAYAGGDVYYGVSANVANQAFYTAGSERLRIDSSGNVGIGTTSPNGKLTISNSGAGGLEFTPDTTAFSVANSNYIASYDRTASAYRDIVFDLGGAENQSIRFKAGGNVGIGVTSPAAKLNTNLAPEGSILAYLDGTSNLFQSSANIMVSHSSSAIGTNTAAGLMLINNNSSNNAPSPLIAFSAKSASGSFNHTYAAIHGIKIASGTDANWNAGALVFRTSDSTGAFERMRIDDSGNLMVGITSVVSNATTTIYKSNLDYGLFIRKGDGTTGSTNKYIGFDISGGGTTGGSITNSSAGNAQFTATSDERLKENIKDVTGCLDKVMALKPSSYTLKQNNLDVPYGFIAQNVETVLPEFVSENEEGYKQISDGLTSGYIAVLTKAIQEQQVLIEQLQAEVALLKGE